MLKSNQLHKYYITRVNGDMSTTEKFITIDKQVLGNDRRRMLDACTLVSCLSYDTSSNTSILVCAPVTGRYHQIRQHLWDSGYPIVNDHEMKKTQHVSEANEYPWEWNEQELNMCDNDVQQYVEWRFEKHKTEFFERKQHPSIQLHAFRYEKVENDKPIWRYETSTFPEWAETVDKELLNSIAATMAKIVNKPAKVITVQDVERVPNHQDKYFCQYKDCIKTAKQKQTAEQIHQKWFRPLHDHECTFHCSKHGLIDVECDKCTKNTEWKKCNYCSKSKNLFEKVYNSCSCFHDVFGV
jgi:hypothetical protein